MELAQWFMTAITAALLELMAGMSSRSLISILRISSSVSAGCGAALNGQI